MSAPRPGRTGRSALGRARFTAKIAIIGAALTLLSGCAGWGFSGSGGGQTVTLTYALWDPHEQIGYQQSIDEFERLHPDIKVDIENVPYGNYEQKMIAEFITGGAPDLFWVNTPWLATFIKDGMLTNIAPLIKADHINMSQYYPQLVALHSRGSAIYGLPKDWDTIGLYYNKAYFAKLHLTVPANLTSTTTPKAAGATTPPRPAAAYSRIPTPPRPA